MNTEEYWKGEAGEKYHARNRVKWWERQKVWAGLLNACTPRSVFEGGCGPGWNLTAIKVERPEINVWGCDLNPIAVRQARAAGLENVDEGSIISELTHDGVRDPYPVYDLTMTVGALIHVPPAEIEETMRLLVAASCGYVLSIEYESEQEEMIEYRGQPDKLWKRPYAKMYEKLGLTPVFAGDVGPADGFDNCHWALFSK